MNVSRRMGQGFGIAIAITFATAVASYLVGADRSVPQALSDGLRLGPFGQRVVELAYYAAAGLAAVAAVATFALLRSPSRNERRIRRSVVGVIPVVVVMLCFVGPDLAVGGAPIGAFTSRGAYSFVSAPNLHPPIVRADVIDPGPLAKGYIFINNFYDPTTPGQMVGQSGPLILDQHLSPVWFKPVPEDDVGANLSLQELQGRPVLAWWQGVIDADGITTRGEYVVVDQHYRVVARLRGADGWVISLHEIVIRGDDAWVTANKNVPADLSRYGGARHGALIDSAVQEYNLKTGKLVWTWDALSRIPVSDTWAPIPTDGSPWDAYHINSIDLPGDGSFVVSMRNTWAAYKVNIATGGIEWTLGGKHSSFKFGSGAEFQWQHNVTVYPGTPLMTVFDDHCCEPPRGGGALSPTGPSRGLVLKLDSATHSATLVDQYTHGRRFDSEYMGNIEPLPNGNEIVGWGSEGGFSEYTAAGRLLLDASLPLPDMTYRATVEPWVGQPLYPPSGAARERDGTTTVYVSWNGATEVASWRVLAGSSSRSLVPIRTVPRLGFETAIEVPPGYRAFRVQALGANGRVLGSSTPFGVAASVPEQGHSRR